MMWKQYCHCWTNLCARPMTLRPKRLCLHCPALNHSSVCTYHFCGTLRQGNINGGTKLSNSPQIPANSPHAALTGSVSAGCQPNAEKKLVTLQVSLSTNTLTCRESLEALCMSQSVTSLPSTAAEPTSCQRCYKSVQFLKPRTLKP